MSVNSDMLVTVSGEVGDIFLQFLTTLGEYEEPDKVARYSNGDISALWECRNHFVDESEEYQAIVDFLWDTLGRDKFVCETFIEGEEFEWFGDYPYLNIERISTYEMYGEPIDLDAIKKPVKRTSMPSKARSVAKKPVSKAKKKSATVSASRKSTAKKNTSRKGTRR